MDVDEATAADGTVDWPRRSKRPRRPVVVTSLAVVAALGLLLTFVPGWAFSTYHKHAAGELVERTQHRLPDVLAVTARARADLTPLGAPVRSWSEVSCSLDPRYSDGDGERDVVMFYYQVCTPAVFEIYALPADHDSLEQTAALLHGRLDSGEHDCDEPILDVVDEGQVDADDRIELEWVQPAANPSAAGDTGCSLPDPGADDVARVTKTTDRPLSADSYVVLSVFGGSDQVSVGCRRNVRWLGSCTAPPKGAPYL